MYVDPVNVVPILITSPHLTKTFPSHPKRDSANQLKGCFSLRIRPFHEYYGCPNWCATQLIDTNLCCKYCLYLKRIALNLRIISKGIWVRWSKKVRNCYLGLVNSAPIWVTGNVQSKDWSSNLMDYVATLVGYISFSKMGVELLSWIKYEYHQSVLAFFLFIDISLTMVSRLLKASKMSSHTPRTNSIDQLFSYSLTHSLIMLHLMSHSRNLFLFFFKVFFNFTRSLLIYAVLFISIKHNCRRIMVQISKSRERIHMLLWSVERFILQ